MIYCGLKRNCSSGYRLWKAAICIRIAPLTILFIVLLTATSPFLSELAGKTTIPYQYWSKSPSTSVPSPVAAVAAMPMLGAAPGRDAAADDLGEGSIVVLRIEVWEGYQKVLGVWWDWELQMGCFDDPFDTWIWSQRKINKH